jgi:nicotinate-nucleotide pyrophosphorylase (carboxylating)
MPTTRDDLNDLALPDLYAHFQTSGLIRRLLELARDEDLGTVNAVDITSASMPDPHRPINAKLNARQPCIVSGLAPLPELLRVFDPSGSTRFVAHRADGEHAPKGTCLGALTGPIAAVLSIERTLLNLVSRLSGVATLTRAFADRIALEQTANTECLYDTRKTTPGLRVLEKYAVRCGGGRCHRLGLHDAVLIKDNHIAGVPDEHLPGAVLNIASNARAAAAASIPPRKLVFIEVEVDTLDQFARLLTLAPGTIDIVLLDNMPPPMLRQAVAMRNRATPPNAPRLELEASGGVSFETIGTIAATGVDRVSAGALTHQAVSVDLGLDMI